jgi:hypothetical protein
MRALAWYGRPWACLGASRLACAHVLSVKGGHEQVQKGEREPVDMVVQARIDQVRGWHELDLPCHGMARFDLFDLSLTSASGGDGVVR